MSDHIEDNLCPTESYSAEVSGCSYDSICPALGFCARQNPKLEEGLVKETTAAFVAGYQSGFDEGEEAGAKDTLTGLTFSKTVGGAKAATRQIIEIVRDDSSVERTIERRRPDNAIVLYFFDGDKFKQINTKFGHSVGDLVISFIGSSLRERDGADATFRWGGDEFIAIMRGYIENNEKCSQDPRLMAVDSYHKFFARVIQERLDERWHAEAANPSSEYKKLFDLGVEMPSFTVGVAIKTLEEIKRSGSFDEDSTMAAASLLAELTSSASLHANAQKQLRDIYKDEN